MKKSFFSSEFIATAYKALGLMNDYPPTEKPTIPRGSLPPDHEDIRTGDRIADSVRPRDQGSSSDGPVLGRVEGSSNGPVLGRVEFGGREEAAFDSAQRRRTIRSEERGKTVKIMSKRITMLSYSLDSLAARLNEVEKSLALVMSTIRKESDDA